ncbi:MAG: GDP-mannose 4,6-dehydratase [Bdellovibrionia bacterium]
MTKRALVAGGAGFIGSHLCEFLLSKGYEVDVADNLATGRKENIKHLFGKGLKWFDVDINNLHILHDPYQEIYNLASPASPIDFERIPEFILNTGSMGHTSLLDLARERKARVLLASTSEVYGDPLEHPQREEYFGNVNSIGLRSCYDEAKRFAEAMTMAYHRRFQVDTRIVRIFNTYGPRMRPEDGRMIPNFFVQALSRKSLTIHGDGKQTRSLCYVSDMVEGIYSVMQSSEPLPINIGNPVEQSVLQLADTVNKLIGNTKAHSFGPGMPDDPKRRCPDISKAKRVCKWEPKVSLEKGLGETLKYFKSQLEAKNT